MKYSWKFYYFPTLQWLLTTQQKKLRIKVWCARITAFDVLISMNDIYVYAKYKLIWKNMPRWTLSLIEFSCTERAAHWSHGFFCFRSTPTGLEDVSRYPQLLATLLEDPTWTEEDIKKLAGLNLLRVFGKVEQVIKIRWYIRVVLLFFYQTSGGKEARSSFAIILQQLIFLL